MKITSRKRFMGYRGRVIYYCILDNGEIAYSVAKGDGTDKYFSSYEEAMEYIDIVKGV